MFLELVFLSCAMMVPVLYLSFFVTESNVVNEMNLPSLLHHPTVNLASLFLLLICLLVTTCILWAL